jgi:hypothetical protein
MNFVVSLRFHSPVSLFVYFYITFPDVSSKTCEQTEYNTIKPSDTYIYIHTYVYIYIYIYIYVRVCVTHALVIINYAFYIYVFLMVLMSV